MTNHQVEIKRLYNRDYRTKHRSCKWCVWSYEYKHWCYGVRFRCQLKEKNIKHHRFVSHFCKYYKPEE